MAHSTRKLSPHNGPMHHPAARERNSEMLNVKPLRIEDASIPALHEIPHDENSFVDWLVSARPGDITVYYRGLLSYHGSKNCLVLDAAARRNLVVVAARVRTAADQHLVAPVQKRLGADDFLYIAIRTSDPVPGVPALQHQSRPAVSGNIRAIAHHQQHFAAARPLEAA